MSSSWSEQSKAGSVVLSVNVGLRLELGEHTNYLTFHSRALC